MISIWSSLKNLSFDKKLKSHFLHIALKPGRITRRGMQKNWGKTEKSQNHEIKRN